MFSISGRHDRRQVIFDVAIVGVSRNAEPYFLGEAPAIGVFSEPVKALVDTGATSTSISPEAVRRIGLNPVGKKDVLTANGFRRLRCYDFQVAVMPGRGPDGDEVDSPFYVLPQPVVGTELDPRLFTFDILLGMDAISQGDLIIRRNGTFTFEF